MGIHVLPNPQSAAGKPDFDFESRDMAAMDLPLYASDQSHPSDERREVNDHLGCLRGIAVALAIQTAVFLAIFALWRIL